MIDRILVLGGGSAGFLASIFLKTFLPNLSVKVVRSADIGIIGVGEGSLDALTRFLHTTLGIDPNAFIKQAAPTWKLGLRFLNWGPRPHFDYTFGRQLMVQWRGLPRLAGFYCDDVFEDCGPAAALMSANRVFQRSPQGGPKLDSFAYHVENKQFVGFLEAHAAHVGVQIEDDTVVEVKQDERGVSSLLMRSGRTETADLYVDCSGFASVLLGKALGEPFVSYDKTLYCDRSVVGGWDRESDEPIQPYTTVEGMTSGWCWRIDHENRINRGYVYSSSFISDDEAEREFRATNPKVKTTRIVPFRTGRYRSTWVKNVVGIGNAGGFVEPLEATALAEICQESHGLAQALIETDRQPRPLTVECYNRRIARRWDDIRDFLGVHYRFNTRFDNDFWRACRADVEIGAAAELVEFYCEHGPTGLFQLDVVNYDNPFGLEGYWSLLVGQKVPYRRTYTPTPQERAKWETIRSTFKAAAQGGYTVKELLETIRSGRGAFAPMGQVRGGALRAAG
jgi:tryptophan halogenase